MYKHNTNQVAGRIRHLSYTDDGQLRIRCEVTHAFAKTCGAFSVSAKILAYELRQVDDPKNFHALVTNAELDEISLTDVPADPVCAGLQRSTPSALGESYAKTMASVDRLKAMVAALPPHLFVASAPKRELPAASHRELTAADRVRLDRIHERAARRFHAATLPAPMSSFGSLVAELNSRMEA